MPWRTHCIRVILGVHHLTTICCSEFSQCTCCSQLLVSASIRIHLWYPLPLLPVSWIFPKECERKNKIFFAYVWEARHWKYTWNHHFMWNHNQQRVCKDICFSALTMTSLNTWLFVPMWNWHLYINICHYLKIEIEIFFFWEIVTVHFMK